MPPLLVPRHHMLHRHRRQCLRILDVENKAEVRWHKFLSLRHQRRHAVVDVVGRHRRRCRISERPRLQRRVWTSPTQRHHDAEACVRAVFCCRGLKHKHHAQRVRCANSGFLHHLKFLVIFRCTRPVLHHPARYNYS
eukprot:1347425-Rhodomonas_salina.1